MRLSELGEFGLLAELERRGLVRGQDAEGAVLADGVVVAQDTLVEVRALAASGRPGAISLLGPLPPRIERPAAPRSRGAARRAGSARGRGRRGDRGALRRVERARRAGLGGDTTRAGLLVLTVTAAVERARPWRAGAVPGDLLVVTGPPAARRPDSMRYARAWRADELVERHRRPPLRLEEGRRLAPVAHALVDLSDGLAGDAARIAERSGCRIVLDSDAVPRAARIEEVADLPFWTLGEDYELLAAPRAAGRAGARLSSRGTLRRGSGVEPEGLAG